MRRLSDDWWTVILGLALVVAASTGIIAVTWDKW